ASITSNSRMLFAFARDGGLPGSALVARVSERYRTPHVAIWISAAAAFLVAIWTEGVLRAMTALSTIALYASYGLPIAAGLWARATGRWKERGPWDLGRHSLWVNLLSLLWIAVLTALFVLPPNQIAGLTFAGCLVLLALFWFLWMRRRFRGPKVALAAEPVRS